MAKIQFENGKVVEFDGNPTQSDIEDVANQLGFNKPQQSLAESALNLTKKLSPFSSNLPSGNIPDMSSFTPDVEGISSMVKTAPPLSPIAPIQNNFTDIKNAGISADKNYPVQNMLPTVGMIGGGIAGTLGGSVLGSVPGGFIGRSAGSTSGAMIGEELKQGIDKLRGNQFPKTMGESAQKIGIEGGKGLLSEVVAAPINYAIGKVGEFAGANKYAQKGFKYLGDKVQEIFTPVPKTEITGALEKLKDIPVTKDSEAAKFVDGIFEKGKLSIPGGINPAETSNRLKNMMEGGMAEEDAMKILQNIPSSRESLSRIASGRSGRVQAELPTTPASDYQGMADVLQTMEKKNLTYGDLDQVKTDIASYANFGAPDYERTPIQKLYGSLYHKVNEDAAKTAEEGGAGNLHKFVNKEQQKGIAQKILGGVFERNTKTIGGEDVVSFNGIANDLGRKNYSTDSLKRQFGDLGNVVETVRDLADTYSKNASENALSGSINSGGRVYERIGLGQIKKRLTMPSATEAAITKRMGSKVASEMTPNMFPRPMQSGIYPRILPTSLQIPSLLNFPTDQREQ